MDDGWRYVEQNRQLPSIDPGRQATSTTASVEAAARAAAQAYAASNPRGEAVTGIAQIDFYQGFKAGHVARDGELQAARALLPASDDEVNAAGWAVCEGDECGVEARRMFAKGWRAAESRDGTHALLAEVAKKPCAFIRKSRTGSVMDCYDQHLTNPCASCIVRASLSAQEPQGQPGREGATP